MKKTLDIFGSELATENFLIFRSIQLCYIEGVLLACMLPNFLRYKYPLEKQQDDHQKLMTWSIAIQCVVFAVLFGTVGLEWWKAKHLHAEFSKTHRAIQQIKGIDVVKSENSAQKRDDRFDDHKEELRKHFKTGSWWIRIIMCCDFVSL